MSFSTGVFPTIRKVPKVAPVYKKTPNSTFQTKISLLKIKKYSTFHALVSLTENIRKRLRVLGKLDLDNRNIGDECCCDCG